MPLLEPRPGSGDLRRRMPLAASVACAILPVLAGRRWPGYSHRRHYISELGAHDAPDGAVVSAGFVSIGLGLLCGVRASDHGRSIVLAGLGGSYVVTGVFRCDPGCPDRGTLSTRQQIHNIAGVTGYALAIVGVSVDALASQRSGLTAHAAIGGAAALVAASAATLAATTSSRGRYQRVLELVVLAWASTFGVRRR